MPRFRQIYNIWGVYVGPSPASGYHYEDYNQDGHNNSELGIFDFNRVKQIDRINSFNYSIDIERINLAQLGVRSLVERPIVNHPTVQINFNYWAIGVRNEARLGMVVNYPNITGTPVINGEISCFDNFITRDTDYRNLFVAIKPDNNDLNGSVGDQFGGGQPSGLFTLGFGDCYLNSYKISASVGNIPQVSVGFIGDNMTAFSSGSGVNIPAIYPKSGQLISGLTFTIPKTDSVPIPSILRPSDITVKFLSADGNEASDAFLGVNNSGIPIQSFDLSINLDREELKSIGYAVPIDRRLNFPILANFNITSIITDNSPDNLVNKLSSDNSYTVQIDIRNPGCGGLNNREIALQYKLKPSKLSNISYNYDLRGNLIGNFSFTSEVDIDNPNKGMFISGLLNAPFPIIPYYFLTLQDNKNNILLLTEDGNPLIISEIPSF